MLWLHCIPHSEGLIDHFSSAEPSLIVGRASREKSSECVLLFVLPAFFRGWPGGFALWIFLGRSWILHATSLWSMSKSALWYILVSLMYLAVFSFVIIGVGLDIISYILLYNHC